MVSEGQVRQRQNMLFLTVELPKNNPRLSQHHSSAAFGLNYFKLLLAKYLEKR